MSPLGVALPDVWVKLHHRFAREKKLGELSQVELFIDEAKFWTPVSGAPAWALLLHKSKDSSGPSLTVHSTLGTAPHMTGTLPHVTLITFGGEFDQFPQRTWWGNRHRKGSDPRSHRQYVLKWTPGLRDENSRPKHYQWLLSKWDVGHPSLQSLLYTHVSPARLSVSFRSGKLSNVTLYPSYRQNASNSQVHKCVWWMKKYTRQKD